MKLNKKIFLLISTIILAYTFVSSQFCMDCAEYLSLKKYGKIVETTMTCYPKSGYYIYGVGFETESGYVLIEQGECSTYIECRNIYQRQNIIYLPDAPHVFSELTAFWDYSLISKLIIYFVISGIICSIVPIYLIKLILKIIYMKRTR
ncbi:MAG: hypothetical protein V1720_10890 [bacterium]